MRSNADELIRALTPAIEQKCGELQRARKERLQSRLFVLLCAMVVFVPALLVFAGISLTMLLAPLGFMSLSVLLLLPVLLSGRTEKQGGIMYEQAENMLSKWNFQKNCNLVSDPCSDRRSDLRRDRGIPLPGTAGFCMAVLPPGGNEGCGCTESSSRQNCCRFRGCGGCADP